MSRTKGSKNMGPVIGWSHKEIIWLRAALTLPAIDFFLACEDIASMTGRTVAAVTQQAKKMQREREKNPTPRVAGNVQLPLRQPTKQQLIGGSAKRAKAFAPG